MKALDRVRDLLQSVKYRGHFIFVLLRAWLSRIRLRRVKFVAITGSAGKTTTKDYCVELLSHLGPCKSNFLSNNRPQNVAETIINTKVWHRYCVLEVSGANPRDMDWPLRLFKPDIAVLTIVEREHSKSFSGLEAIAAEKSRLIKALRPGGVAVLNIDDPLVRRVGEALSQKIIWIGRDKNATIRLIGANSFWPDCLSVKIAFGGQEYDVRTGLYGEHLALSVLCALAVAIASGMSMEDAVRAAAALQPTEGRMQVVDGGGGVTFVRDDWKAPLWSLQAPIEFMSKAIAARKVIVVGTLSDYSRSASKLYPKIAREIAEVADLTVFVGPHAMRAVKGKSELEGRELYGFVSPLEASVFLKQELRSGDLVLLKGSNKTDHLTRLWLDRLEPVTCWVSKCGRTRFCTRCDKVRAPVDDGATVDASSYGERARDPGSTREFEPSPRPDYLIVGLGNEGERYAGTRHNVGCMFVEWMVSELSGEWQQHSSGLISDVTLDGTRVRAFKPAGLINLSGPIVLDFVDECGMTPDACLFVHDDIDLPLGDIRLKQSGGDGGHLGMRSLVSSLGHGDVMRIRIGVRSAEDTRKARQMVLERFSEDEASMLSAAFGRGVRAIRERLAGQNNNSDGQAGGDT